MKLLNLELEAFGPYAQTQKIDFSPAHQAGIFLIQGPTGSGKSSILDAISFCLYGSHSAEKREISDIRSHFAQSDQITRTVLEFQVNDTRYRCARLLKPKKNGDFEQVYLLEELINEEWTVKYSKLSQANDAMTEILGLKADQFKKVILLPQGQFREFLSSSSQEKGEILKSLFNTYELDAFMQELAQQVSQLKDSLKRLQDKKQNSLEASGLENPEALEERCVRLEEELAEKDLLYKSLLEASEVYKKKEQNYLRRQEILRTLASYEEQLKTLENEKSQKEGDKIRLKRAQSLLPISPLGSAVKLSKEELARHLEKLQEFEAAILQGTQKLSLLQEDSRNLKTALAKWPQLGESLAQGEKLLQDLQWLRSKQTELEKSQVRLNLLSQSQQENSNGLKIQQSKLAALPDEDEEKHFTEALQNLKNLASQEKSNSLSLIEEKDFLLEQDTILKADLSTKNTEEQRLKTLEADLALLEKHQEAFLVYELAQNLQPGHACPVCGSLEHPAPAKAQNPGDVLPDISSKRKDLQALSKSLLDLTVQITSRNQSLVEHQERIKKLELEQKTLKNKLWTDAQALGAFFTKTGIDVQDDLDEYKKTQDQEKAETSQELTDKLIETLQEAFNKLRQIKKVHTGLLQELMNELKTQEGEHKSLMNSLQQLKDDCTSLKEAFDASCEDAKKLYVSFWEKDLQNLFPKGLSFYVRSSEDLDLSVAKEELLAAKKRAKTLEEAHHSWQQELQEAQNALGAYQSRKKDAQTELELIQKRLSTQETEWMTALTKAGFADIEDARNSFLSEKAMQELESRLQTWEQEYFALQKNLQAKKTEYTALDPDLDSFSLQEGEALQEDLKTVLSDLGAAKNELASLKTLQVNLSEYQKEQESLDKAYSLQEGLFRVFQGQENQSKITLQRYALSVFLDEVLEMANVHLDTMSRGRYCLRRNEEGADRRRSAGLDIEILDAYSGQSRASSSLSGGEGFMASLALALGLSATVHIHAGGLRLDTLLIDEGFGSLDEESLQDAMNVLVKLQEKGQIIGIISHVRELKERIPCQLLIEKTRHGSRLSWA